MRTHAHTKMFQLCASLWAWSLMAWAAPLEDLLQLEHRGTPDDQGMLLADNTPLGDGMMPEGGSFMTLGQDGSYRFGLQSDDQWRMESRNPDGVVEGRYVYKSPDGQTVDISYNAGPQGFIAEGDAIPGGKAPLIDAPVTDNENCVAQVLESSYDVQSATLSIEDPDAIPYGALHVRNLQGFQPVAPDGNLVADFEAVVPYGALHVNSLPAFQPVVPDENSLEDLKAQAFIISAPLYNSKPLLGGGDAFIDLIYGPVLPPNDNIWPPKLTFPRLDGFRTDVVYGPAQLNGKELVSGVIEA